jgi:hypothetical protein
MHFAKYPTERAHTNLDLNISIAQAKNRMGKVGCRISIRKFSIRMTSSKLSINRERVVSKRPSTRPAGKV